MDTEDTNGNGILHEIILLIPSQLNHKTDKDRRVFALVAKIMEMSTENKRHMIYQETI